ALMEADYPDSVARALFIEQLLPRLQQVPEIEALALSTALPGLGSGGPNVRIEGQDYDLEGELPWARGNSVSATYFETYGVRVQEGRSFTEQDRMESLPVAMVNQAFATRYFSDESAVGRRIRFGREPDAPWVTIVG